MPEPVGRVSGRSGLTECPILRNLSEIKAGKVISAPRLRRQDGAAAAEFTVRLCVQWAKIKGRCQRTT